MRLDTKAPSGIFDIVNETLGNLSQPRVSTTPVTHSNATDMPTTWKEAESRIISSLNYQFKVGALSATRLKRRMLDVGRLNYFWESLSASTVRSIAESEVITFFTDAISREGTFAFRSRSNLKNDFGGRNVSVAVFNSMLSVCRLIAAEGMAADAAKGIHWDCRNPFESVEFRAHPGAQPFIPTNAEFSQTLNFLYTKRPGCGSHKAYLTGCCAVFVATTGAWIGEVLGSEASTSFSVLPHPGLRWKDLHEGDSEVPHVSIKTVNLLSKTADHRIRTVPIVFRGLSNLINEMRAKLYRGDPDALVFEGLTVPGIHSALRSAHPHVFGDCLSVADQENIKFPKLSPDNLRHLFAVNLISAGFQIPMIAKWLGYSDGGRLAGQRYAHYRKESKEQLQKRVFLQRTMGLTQKSWNHSY